MIKNYRVDIKPLEPYTFGTEQGSEFKGTGNQGKKSYIIASQNMPDQTTILGVLRYIVLSNKGLLNTSFKYSGEEQQQISELIGKESFSFEKGSQTFGKIESLSSLFIRDGEGNILVKNPLCNKEQEAGYTSFKMSTPVLTSRGKVSFPIEEYDTKKGCVGGYIRLKDYTIVSEYDLFKKNMIVGNRVPKEGTNKNEDGFFKREVVSFGRDYEDYVFSVYVKAQEGAFPEHTIAFMGRKQSAFSFNFTECENEDLTVQVQKSFPEGKAWYMALSDCFGIDTLMQQDFYIAFTKKIRNMETVSYNQEGKYVDKRIKIKNQYNLVQAGSVFVTNPHFAISEELNKKCQKFGYNCIVKIGGTEA